jgi:hypothetical protein
MQLSSKVGHALEASAMDDIGLQRMKERLHVGVLVRSATAGRALAYPVFIQSPAQRRTEELTAAIAVKDQSSFRATSAQRRFDRTTGEL